MFTRRQNNMDTASAAFSLPVDTPVLEGYVDQNDEVGLRALQRDMYFSDVICGATVDIYASIPFGDFSLSGLPDREMLYKFLSCCEKLRLKSLFPAVAIDYLVDGAICGAFNFNEKEKIFDAYIPFNLNDTTLTHLPFHGAQPLVDVKFTGRPKFNMNDPRMQSFVDNIPQLIREAYMTGKTLQVAPENAIYMARRAGAHGKNGISLFRRIISLWLVEKALLRGTIEISHRRQRGITHATVGDGMDWVPDQAQMSAIGEMIINADRDPLGAVIVTRPGVQISNLGSGQNDLWKHSDVVDQYTSLKLKCMGVSESLYSGELTVGSAESIMSIFNQSMRAFRDDHVRGFLYERVFPLTAIANGYERDERNDISSDQAELIERQRFNGSRIFRKGNEYYGVFDGRMMDLGANGQAPEFNGRNLSDYYMPTMNFHNSLRPEASGEYMEMLNVLEQRGVPIPMRTLIAAGGMSIGDLMTGMDEDLELRKTMADYNKKISKFKPKEPNMDMQSLLDTASAINSASRRRRSLLSREDDFNALDDRMMFNRNGRRLISAKGKKILNERANKVTAEASVNLARQENHSLDRVVPLRRPA